MPTIYMMVGSPCSGKSTYINNTLNNCEIISSDNIIENIAKEQNKTYSEVFHEVNFKDVEKEMFEEFKNAIENNKNIVVDRTNMTIKSRRRFLSNIPKHYIKYAIVFDTDKETIFKRNKERFEKTGKHIPENVIESFIKNFQMPSKEEGFEYIIIMKE